MLETTRSWLEIDYGAIAHNVQEVQKLVGKTKIMGIVKADAYGHDMVKCAKALKLSGVDFFGVACLSEALTLRKAGILDDILILGYTHPSHFQQLVDYGLTQSILSFAYAQKLAAFGGIKGHLKLDTGMNRTGILYQDQKKDYDQVLAIYQMDGLEVTGIFSHFPVSDDLQEEAVQFTTHQIDLFNECVRRLRADGVRVGLRHIQNSYGILNYGDLGMDYCRPGLLYMGVTSDQAIGIRSKPNFKPILTWKTNISMVKDILPGMSVSYGRHFVAKEKTKVASLAVGYADGLPRALSNTGMVVGVNGKACPVIGNICMDQCMLDVSGVDCQEGDEVILIGPGFEVDRLSHPLKTINNETLCRLGNRLARIDIRDIKK